MVAADTRTRLVLTAMRLFWEKGYGSTSVADVLQAAKVNSGSLYHFFPGKQDLLLVAEVNGELVGQAGLHPAGVAIRRRHAMYLGISVASTAQRQGIGTALMTALCDYADNWLACLRIELTVYTDNEIAQRLYRNFGFEVEGTLRAYALRDGVYVDAYSMARLHPNPPTVTRSDA